MYEATRGGAYGWVACPHGIRNRGFIPWCTHVTQVTCTPDYKGGGAPASGHSARRGVRESATCPRRTASRCTTCLSCRQQDAQKALRTERARNSHVRAFLQLQDLARVLAVANSPPSWSASFINLDAMMARTSSRTRATAHSWSRPRRRPRTSTAGRFGMACARAHSTTRRARQACSLAAGLAARTRPRVLGRGRSSHAARTTQV